MAADPVLQVDDLHVHFPVRDGLLGAKTTLRAVDGVSFAIPRGATLGLVGESGCGKTTLIRTILGLQRPEAGRILLGGQDLTALGSAELRAVRPKMQVVFQDPSSSLNPRMTIHDIVAEPLRINRCYRPDRVDELLSFVGMTSEISQRRPVEFSGGQRQRIGIARALALEPELLILDEPVSALDVSIQAQIINLLTRLQVKLGLTYLFVAHDLSVVRHMSHQVAVMYHGTIVEMGPKSQVLGTPAHPYTQSLISAVPVPQPEGRDERRARRAKAPAPDRSSTGTGCAFAARCPRVQDRCVQQRPPLGSVADIEHSAACWFPGVGSIEDNSKVFVQ
jgi:oligopeptide transport system ATP-binding protein